MFNNIIELFTVSQNNSSKNNITPNIVKKHLSGIAKGDVERYLLPNLLSLNLIIKGSLEGGGSDTLLHDAQGKTHSQQLLSLELDVPEDLRVLNSDILFVVIRS